MWLSLRLELDLIIRMSRRTWTTHLPIFLINSVKVSNIPPGKTCAHTYPNLKRACMNCFSNCYHHFDIWYLHRSGSSVKSFTKACEGCLDGLKCFLSWLAGYIALFCTHCVTRAPHLYFIRSWVALSFKVVSEWVSEASVTPVQISTFCNI